MSVENTEKKENTLSPHLKDRYELVGLKPGPANVPLKDNKRQDIDTRIMTAEQADALIAAGCKHIKKIEAKGSQPIPNKAWSEEGG